MLTQAPPGRGGAAGNGMKGWNNLGTDGKVASICLICAAIAALGYGVWQSGSPPAGGQIETATASAPAATGIAGQATGSAA